MLVCKYSHMTLLCHIVTTPLFSELHMKNTISLSTAILLQALCWCWCPARAVRPTEVAESGKNRGIMLVCCWVWNSSLNRKPDMMRPSTLKNSENKVQIRFERWFRLTWRQHSIRVALQVMKNSDMHMSVSVLLTLKKYKFEHLLTYGSYYFF